MGCNCGNSQKAQFEVVSAAGKVLFTSVSKATADAVSKRYAESSVREKPKVGPVTAPAPAAPTVP